MGLNKEVKPYVEVWGDTVSLNHLLISSALGVVLTLGMYLIGRSIFLNIPNLEPGLAKGYSLLVGIVGCLTAGIISAVKFKPKRIIEEKFESSSIEDILAAAGMTVEEEIEGLRTLDSDLIKEMEEFELYGLLALIPEDSPNYKPEYKTKLKEG
ncbi:MAG: hypothetical protein LBS00_03080 [Synergistaceae bacterium]|jgi:hypothetical protein|nr:hypothetical protein [Synergistaceae bacterium]